MHFIISIVKEFIISIYIIIYLAKKYIIFLKIKLRDLKLENILYSISVGDGLIKLIDFGLSEFKLLSRRGSLTGTVGTMKLIII
jgi:serine/threonine protein kinase